MKYNVFLPLANAKVVGSFGHDPANPGLFGFGDGQLHAKGAHYHAQAVAAVDPGGGGTVLDHLGIAVGLADAGLRILDVHGQPVEAVAKVTCEVKKSPWAGS